MNMRDGSVRQRHHVWKALSLGGIPTPISAHSSQRLENNVWEAFFMELSMSEIMTYPMAQNFA